MRYLSVCSGMEAASVAWHPLGWTPVGFSEIEPFPCAILKHRFPNVPNYGSLTEYQSWPLEPGSIDLLVGGTPCQSFSVAGLRKGLADPRGNLALTFLGLADKLKPRWIVWENVPGVLSSNGGRDFGSFVGALGQLGYGWAMRILDAQYVGGPRAVPQRRRRVFVVACLGDWRAAAEVLSLREGLRGYLEAGNKKRKGVAADAGASPAAGCWWDGGQVSQTLDAVLAKGQTMPEKNRFPAVLQPFRKSKRAASTTDDESWVPAEASNTLNNFDLGDTRTTHAVVEPQVYENHAQDSRVTGPLDIAPTVAAKFGTGGGNVPLVNQEAIPIHDQATRHAGKRGDNQDGKGNGLGIDKPGDPMNTLTRGDHHAVYSPPMAVRRLTPVECERLQGFPDNWSRISWKGKPEEECPDGPRYKACGNSMAVPVMAFIGRQIAAVDSTIHPHA